MNNVHVLLVTIVNASLSFDDTELASESVSIRPVTEYVVPAVRLPNSTVTAVAVFVSSSPAELYSLNW